jgi:hypothetical protein
LLIAGCAVAGLASGAFFRAATAPKPFSWTDTADETEAAATKPVIATEAASDTKAPAGTVRSKFSDAGKTTRTPRPTFASRAITAANDTVRNAFGAPAMAMPTPA